MVPSAGGIRNPRSTSNPATKYNIQTVVPFGPWKGKLDMVAAEASDNMLLLTKPFILVNLPKVSLSFLILLLFSVNVALSGSIVKYLPGYGELPFKLETG
jgi:hypothetical protein